MRNVLSLVLMLSLSGASAAAAQQTPPPPAPPAASAPATRPPTAAPSAPTSRPGAMTPPATRPPSISAPSAQPTPGAPPAAQTPRPGAAPSAPAAASTAPPASWQNVRLDVTISDSLSADVQIKKTVSVLILDGRSAQVRSASGGIINIDASPSVRPDGRIFLRLTVEYRPEISAQQIQQTGASPASMFNQSLALLVTDGKPLVAAQAADPHSDRKVSIEVTASVVK